MYYSPTRALACTHAISNRHTHFKLHYPRRLALLLLAAIGVFASAPDIFAATFTITNINDSGPGSLRQAVIDSNANLEEDTITFDPAVFNVPRTITLNGALVINGSTEAALRTLTIQGPGANLLTIDANNTGRVFTIVRDARAVVLGLTLTGGNGVGGNEFAGTGGAILMLGGFMGTGVQGLVLKDSIVTGNRSGSSGGGLFLAGWALIENCLITNNISDGFGAGIGTSIRNRITIVNSTISGNRTNASGAGIYNHGSEIELINSTIAFNTGVPAGGIGIAQSDSLFDRATVFTRNSIISNNLAGGAPADLNWTTVSRGNNIIGQTFGYTPISGDTVTDQMGVDPQLDPTLKLNGGIIPTHALGTGSPAIDRGNDCVLTAASAGGCLDLPITTDQRGVTRPRDGDSDGTAHVDIGAFEITEQEVALAPGRPDLLSTDDSGISNSDNLTSNRTLNFTVDKIVSGATVEFYKNGTLIDTKVANGTTISFIATGLPADGQVAFKARQVINAENSFFGPSTVVTIDNTAPTVTVNQHVAQQDPTSSMTIYFTAGFSEPVFGLAPSDISVAGTAGVSGANVTINGSGPYELVVSNISSDGTVIASMPTGVATDAAGNHNTASTSTDNTVTFDTMAPTVTVNQAATQLDPTRTLPVNFTVVFSEPVTGFTSADISLAGSTANVASATKTVTGSGSTYNVAVSGFSSQGGTIVVSVPAASAQDAALHFNTASTSADNSVLVDNVAPTVTINQAAGQADPTNVIPVNFSVVFSEPVTGFDAVDVSLSGSFGFSTTTATISVTGSGAVYNVAVGNIVSNFGSLRVSIRSAAATDAFGNSSFASTSTDNLVTVDNVGPTLSINQGIGQADPASSQPIRFSVIFNDLVNGFDVGDISLVSSTANVSAANVQVTGSGSVYFVTISNVTSTGTVRLTIPAGAATDAIGNPSMAAVINDNTISVFVPTAFDYDGDGRSDLSVRRPSDNIWYLQQGTAGFTAMEWGLIGDRMAPADYDGDGKTDITVFRPSNGAWYIFLSQSRSFQLFNWGQEGDLPVPADRDGDGRTDLTVFRPSNNTWYTRFATGEFTATVFGEAGDKPVSGDFDRDGRDDIAVFRPTNNNWYILKSGVGYTVQTWGEPGDIPVPADYDGDGTTDIAVFRPSTGQWFAIGSTAGFTVLSWGQTGDVPVPADYDGDGQADAAIFRPANSTWYLFGSASGIRMQQFGHNGDVPTQNSFVY